MPFVTDEELKSSLVAQLKVGSPADLPPFFSDDIVARSNNSAYQDIIGRLIARGYTKAQADLWDRGAEFQLAIGLYWCLVNAGAYGMMDPETARALDRRKELGEIIVAVNGVWTRPTDADNPGMVVSSGPSAAGSMFNLPGPGDDSRIGEITQW